MAELLLASEGRPSLREVAGLHFVTVRHFPADTSVAAALAGLLLPALPGPGKLAGVGPWLAWRGPQEGLLIATEQAQAQVQALLHALAPGRSDTAIAVDLSESMVCFELYGPRIDEWLAHLVDAQAVPREAGRASRARLADVSVLLLRPQPERLWLLGDWTLAAYLRNWLAFAHEGAFFDLDRVSQ